MKALGMVRPIDNLGRVVLPAELRKMMDLEKDTPVEIFVDEDKIILKKYQPACAFCGSVEDTITFKGKLVCRECAEKLGKIFFD